MPEDDSFIRAISGRYDYPKHFPNIGAWLKMYPVEMDPLDWMKAVLAVGVTIYAFLIYQKLKGGRMAEPYLIFTVCGLAAVCTQIFDILNFDVIRASVSVVFYALLLAGFSSLYSFRSLYRLWSRFDKEEMPNPL